MKIFMLPDLKLFAIIRYTVHTLYTHAYTCTVHTYALYMHKNTHRHTHIYMHTHGT